jgi:hypothetical protein
VLSVADLANRLVSLRIAPSTHPLHGDAVGRLAVAGCAAAVRRFDVRWPMKLMFAGWFLVMAVVPRRIAVPLAEAFLFPERRPRLNPLLARLNRAAYTKRYGPGA